MIKVVTITNFEMKGIILVRKAMYDKKRQLYLLFPSFLNDALRQLYRIWKIKIKPKKPIKICGYFL